MLAGFHLAGLTWTRSWTLAEHLLRNLSYTFKHEGQNFFFFLSYSDLKVKSENRKAAVLVLHCSNALTPSMSLRAGWYQRRRLNGSSDELPGFVWWRKFTGHEPSEVFSFCLGDHSTPFSHISFIDVVYLMASWFQLSFSASWWTRATITLLPGTVLPTIVEESATGCRF